MRLFKAYHMPARYSDGYFTADLLGDILGRSKSSRLYEKLVKETDMFSNINGYITGSDEPGLLIIQGNLTEGVSIEEGDQAIGEIVADLMRQPVSDTELTKGKEPGRIDLGFFGNGTA